MKIKRFCLKFWSSNTPPIAGKSQIIAFAQKNSHSDTKKPVVGSRKDKMLNA